MSTTWSGPYSSMSWSYGSTTMSSVLSDGFSHNPTVFSHNDPGVVRTDTTTPRCAGNYCDIPRTQAHRILYILEVIVIPSISILGVFGNVSSIIVLTRYPLGRSLTLYLCSSALSIPGIFGNVSSIIVLTRQGFSRSSNILLMAVSISDFFTLLGISNVFKIWRTHFKSRISLQQARALFDFNAFQTFVLEMGYCMTILVTVLITVERIIAVYLPLKFPVIVRPFRTKIALLFCLAVAIFKGIMGVLFLEFAYNARKQIPNIKISDFYKNNMELYDVLTNIWDYGLGFIPVAAVSLGCILIAVKVSLAAAKRAKMLSSSGGAKPGSQQQQQQQPAHKSRTTLTLLTVGVQFTLTLGIGFLIETLFPDEQTWLSYIVRYRVSDVSLCGPAYCDWLRQEATSRCNISVCQHVNISFVSLGARLHSIFNADTERYAKTNRTNEDIFVVPFRDIDLMRTGVGL
ncbi:hypothetical protein EGW08_001563 [Elysia chlorotica]|uniref:G-protein coupled receptors family 1 profile domain-containing protein n=1 Tax=Elysia chlorotica TaxID=188477 RepID=A0A433UA28_ELYCH|nr:hypothetical protein EGW08_001563 [Elysia chlorotica]